MIQGDADRDLADYPDGAFDYAILSLTIQATRQPKTVLEQLLRIGRSAIVSFPNFGHWQVRARLAFTGRMPVTENLPEAWYVSPNAHLCTIKDFADLCRVVERAGGARRGLQRLGPAARHLDPAHRAQPDGREGRVHADAAVGALMVVAGSRQAGQADRGGGLARPIARPCKPLQRPSGVLRNKCLGEARTSCYDASLVLWLFRGSSAVEQPAVNRLVVGSNPTRGANDARGDGHQAAQLSANAGPSLDLGRNIPSRRSILSAQQA